LSKQTTVRKPKFPWIRIILFAVICGILGYIDKRIAPMVVADSAVLQLQDSDAAYAQFKGTQDLFKWFWVLYVVTFVVLFLGYFKRTYLYLKQERGE